MIRKKADVAHIDATMFGGPGELHADQILTKDEFSGKGRLFNRCVLHPGDAVGVHPHTNEFEVYYILSGEGLYTDNGVQSAVQAGDVTVCLSGESHGLANTGSEDLVFIALILFS